MTKQEFKRAFEVAKSGDDLDHVDYSALDGCGLPDFQPVHTTIDAVARLIRWQARYMNGGWDSQELDNVAQIARKRFIIIG